MTVCALTYRQLLYCGSIVTSDYSLSVVAAYDFEQPMRMSIQYANTRMIQRFVTNFIDSYIYN